MPVAHPGAAADEFRRYVVFCGRMEHQLSLPMYPGAAHRLQVIFLAGKFELEEANAFIIQMLDEMRVVPPDKNDYFQDAGVDCLTMAVSLLPGAVLGPVLQNVADQFGVLEFTDSYTFYLTKHNVTQALHGQR